MLGRPVGPASYVAICGLGNDAPHATISGALADSFRRTISPVSASIAHPWVVRACTSYW
ncbi:hypothetical protein [Lacisediminihabitans sp.]|uniref:hypothetical protein n=1 Tax=Lacisediminihabitans sp. TaxID=2787631 RepID=UPI002F95B42F